MPKILSSLQQFNLQQKIARKSISNYYPKIVDALQHDFNRAASIVKELGASQAVNYKVFFSEKKINNILRNLYENVGGYTAMRYEKIFDNYKKDDSVDFGNSQDWKNWIDMMLAYWLSVSAVKLYGIGYTTQSMIVKLIQEAIDYGVANNLTLDEINKRAIANLEDKKMNQVRALLIARTESHQALSSGAMTAVLSSSVPLYKQWVASEYPAKSGQPRIWHRELDAKTDPEQDGARIPVTQAFLVNTPGQGVIEMQYAHDAAGGAKNNCNCRCCTVYSV